MPYFHALASKLFCPINTKVQILLNISQLTLYLNACHFEYNLVDKISMIVFQ